MDQQTTMILLVGVVCVCFLSSAGIAAFFYFNEDAKKWFNKNILGKSDDDPIDEGPVAPLTPEEQAAADKAAADAAKAAEETVQKGAEEEKKQQGSSNCSGGNYWFCPRPGYTLTQKDGQTKCCATLATVGQSCDTVKPLQIATKTDRSAEIKALLSKPVDGMLVRDASYGKPVCGGGKCSLLVNYKTNPMNFKTDTWAVQYAYDINQPFDSAKAYRVCKPWCPKSGKKLGAVGEDARSCFLNTGKVEQGNNVFEANSGQTVKWKNVTNTSTNPSVSDLTRDAYPPAYVNGPTRLLIGDCKCSGSGNKKYPYALAPKSAATNKEGAPSWSCAEFTDEGFLSKQCGSLTSFKDKS